MAQSFVMGEDVADLNAAIVGAGNVVYAEQTQEKGRILRAFKIPIPKWRPLKRGCAPVAVPIVPKWRPLK